jgi:hypothetical protein
MSSVQLRVICLTTARPAAARAVSGDAPRSIEARAVAGIEGVLTGTAARAGFELSCSPATIEVIAIAARSG